MQYNTGSQNFHIVNGANTVNCTMQERGENKKGHSSKRHVVSLLNESFMNHIFSSILNSSQLIRLLCLTEEINWKEQKNQIILIFCTSTIFHLHYFYIVSVKTHLIPQIHWTYMHIYVFTIFFSLLALFGMCLLCFFHFCQSSPLMLFQFCITRVPGAAPGARLQGCVQKAAPGQWLEQPWLQPIAREAHLLS